MRAFALFTLLFLCGCDRNVPKQQVIDAAGSNRLVLIDRRVLSISDIVQGHQSYDFHALAWQTNAGNKWTDRAIITKAAFQGGNPRERWVSQIHSIDATNGTAIIKVAEGTLQQARRAFDTFILGESGVCSPTARFALSGLAQTRSRNTDGMKRQPKSVETNRASLGPGWQNGLPCN